jgi:hypothetical protein
VVLDPFGGTGTTALVASALGRHGISVDLSADYLRLARWRTTDPKQVERAWPRLIDASLGTGVGSPTMTEETAPATSDHSAGRAADIAFIADRAADQCRAIWAAHDVVLAGAGTYTEELGAAAINAALLKLADVWRLEADWWEKSNRKGRVSTAAELRACAARVAGVAVKLEQVAKDHAVGDRVPVRGDWERCRRDRLSDRPDRYLPADRPAPRPDISGPAHGGALRAGAESGGQHGHAGHPGSAGAGRLG